MQFFFLNGALEYRFQIKRK